jgi:hypothetical protein
MPIAKAWDTFYGPNTDGSAPTLFSLDFQKVIG